MLPCQGRDSGFNSHRPLRAPVAQWIERIGSNDRVARSTRAGGTSSLSTLLELTHE